MDVNNKERTIQLLMTLANSSTPIKKEVLCERLNISLRTLHRHLEAMRMVGLVVNSYRGGISLERNNNVFRSVSDLLYFSEEEATLLYKAIDNIEGTKDTRTDLKDKLFALYNTPSVRSAIKDLSGSDKLKNLQRAIELGCCVKIVGYSSANSHSLTDRIVEPFAMGTENKIVWCYEPVSQRNKVFSLSRMDAVKVLTDKQWEHRDEHKKAFTDAFRMISHDGKLLDVELILNRRAMNLMIDEYPLTFNDIVQTGENSWIYRGKVSSYIGIGRFVLGLADNIVVNTPAFRDYLRKFAAMYLSYPISDNLKHKDVIW